MENLIQITYLNDFIFCPYSIYLHQIFEDGEIESFQAAPQSEGRVAHFEIDQADSKDEEDKPLRGIYVYSSKLKLYGKIDTFHPLSGVLVERKREIKTIYQGYLYQLWAQYFALIEMGYQVNEIAFETVIGNRYLPQRLPSAADFNQLKNHVVNIALFQPENFENQNPNKCVHCIYAALCDKTKGDHVYT